MKKLFKNLDVYRNNPYYMSGFVLGFAASVVPAAFAGWHIGKCIYNYIQKRRNEAINQDKKGS